MDDIRMSIPVLTVHEWSQARSFIPERQHHQPISQFLPVNVHVWVAASVPVDEPFRGEADGVHVWAHIWCQALMCGVARQSPYCAIQ
jgi:hypothetical protein